MAALPIKMNAFSGVAAGQTANLVLASGVFYQDVYLETDAQPADIKVKLTLNSVVLFDLTGTELDMLNAYYGIQKTANFFSFPMSALFTPELGRRLQTGLNTYPMDNIVIDVEVKSGSAITKLECFAEVRPAVEDRPVVRRFIPYTVPVSAAGEVDFTNVDKKIRVMAAHFASGNMDGLKVERDKQTLFELTKSRNNMILKREKRTPQTGYFHYDPTRANQPVAESLVTASNHLNFKMDMTSSAPENVRTIVDCLDNDPRLVVITSGGGKRKKRR